ncbi:MAG: hypothetical protein C0518_15595 [Opitutus sp.]|nr:hypothetical protein [Opitutus sp.]
MKMTTESFTSFTTMARLGAVSVILGTAALSGFAQSSSSTTPATTGSTRAQERASDRASDRSTMKRDAETAGMSRQDRKFIEKFTELNQREVALSQLAVERATNAQVKAYAQKMVSDHSKAGHEFMTVASGGTLAADASTLASSTSERASSMDARSTDATKPAKTDRDGSLSASTTERSTAAATSDRSRSTASSSTHSGMGMNANSAKDDRMYKKLMGKSGEEFDETYMKAMVDEHEEAIEMLEDIVKDDDRNAQLRAFANKTLPNLRAHLSEAKQIEQSID